jgi:phosphate-selective porin OprO/OprP
MRAARIPFLVFVLLTPLPPARSTAADQSHADAPPALVALTLDGQSPAPVQPQSASVRSDLLQTSPIPSSDSSAPAAPSTFSLTRDLPGGIKFTPIGRLEADSEWVNQSPLNKATVGDLQNTTGFRRARLGAVLSIPDNIEWKSEFDFSNSQFQIINVYLGLIKLPVVGEIRVGEFYEPMGLESQTSSNYITFLERGQNNSLIPALDWGLAMFAPSADRLGLLEIGVFRSGSNLAGTDSSDMNSLACDFRGTRLFWYNGADDDFHLIHLGADYSFRHPPNNTVTFNFQKGPLETGDAPLDPMLVSPVIPSNQQQIANIELAAVRGPLSLQGELTGTFVHQIGGGPVFYNGGYLYASLFLTGEHRGYDLNKGAFGDVKVLRPFGVSGDWRNISWRGFGAVEVALRYSYLDLNDPAAPLTSSGTKPGGTVGQFTVGLNWYLNSNARFMMNISPTTLFNPNTGTSTGQDFSIRFAAFW